MRTSDTVAQPPWPRPLLCAMRPRQFIKNSVVFAALIFSLRLAWRPEAPDTWLPKLGGAMVAFGAFCAVGAAEYLLNDVHDRDRDRQHPLKRRRPIASRQLAPAIAVRAALVLAALGLLLGSQLGWRFELSLTGYAALLLLYTYVLKRVVLLDVVVIAAGFVLRASAGALAIGVYVSPWLLVCTLCGALLLALEKREAELRALASFEQRPVLRHYEQLPLRLVVDAVAWIAVGAYAAYAVLLEHGPRFHALVITLPFVAYGVQRYVQIVRNSDGRGNAEEPLLQDRRLAACVAGWLIVAACVLAVLR